MPPETFAVLREPSSELGIRRAAAAMAEALGGVGMDYVKRLRDAPGLLARRLDENQAKALASALGKQGVGAFVLPESKMAVPPKAEDIRDGKVEEDGFRFKCSKGVLLAPWQEIMYLDCAMVRYEVVRKVAKIRERPTSLTGLGGGMALGMYPGMGSGFIGMGRAFASDRAGTQETRKETASAWREVLDLVCYDPWIHLRIDRETFRYAVADMPLHPTNHLNFAALAVMIKACATKAKCGPGISLLLDGQPTTRSKAASLEAHENEVLWRLQLLWR